MVGAVWATPVVAATTAAPAYAASPCSTTFPHRLDWGTTAYTKLTADSATATITPSSGTGGTPVTMSIASVVSGTVARAADNLTVPATTNIGGLGAAERGLTLLHDSPIVAGRDNRQTVTFTFSRAVTGVAFTITDIDSTLNTAVTPNTGWIDQVELTGTRTGTVPAGSTVIGSGTSTTPWRLSADSTNIATDQGGGNLNVAYSGSLTSFTLTYWSSRAGANQRIYLSDFTFTAFGC